MSRAEENRLLQALAESPNASVTELAKTLGWYTKAGDPYKSKVHRTTTRLKKFKLVTKKRDGFALTDKGKKAIKTEKS